METISPCETQLMIAEVGEKPKPKPPETRCPFPLIAERTLVFHHMMASEKSPFQQRNPTVVCYLTLQFVMGYYASVMMLTSKWGRCGPQSYLQGLLV
jgi:hypothetical protein